MELKRVLGPDSRSATAKAIELYGKEALIISNERVNGKVEVIVAVELGHERTHFRTRFGSAEDAAQGPSREMPLPAPAGDGVRFGALLQERLGELHKPVRPADQAQVQVQVQVQGQAPSRADADRQELDRAKDLVEMLRGEFAEMRKDLRISQQVGVWQLTHGLTDAVKPLASALVEAGVPAGIRSLLVDEVKNMDSLADALAALEASLRQTVRRDQSSGLLAGVHVIGGPSGAGKSMMVARLASVHARSGAYALEEMAVVSFSDQRPGAWSQLQLLSAQAGVDCYRAKDAAMLKELMQELAARPLVLIDTPGVRVFEHLESIASVASAAQFHLLLPVDASAATFKRFLDRSGSGLGWKSLMLSKLDEAIHPWPLIQALCEHALPLSFASRGPALDEPIDALDTDALVAMALRSLPLPPPPPAAEDAAANDGIPHVFVPQVYTTQVHTPRVYAPQAQVPQVQVRHVHAPGAVLPDVWRSARKALK